MDQAAYTQGFMNKCAEYGVDPVKLAQAFPGMGDPKLWPDAPWELPKHGYGPAEPGAHGTWRVAAHNQGLQAQGVQRRLQKSVTAKTYPKLPQPWSLANSPVQGGRAYNRSINPPRVLQFQPDRGRYADVRAKGVARAATGS